MKNVLKDRRDNMSKPNRNRHDGDCQFHGVKANQSESYKLRQEAERSTQADEDAWWSKPKVVVIMTIVFTCMDGLVIYSIMNRAMTESFILGVITAFGIALILNAIPLVIARFIHYAIYKTKRFALTMAILSTVAFGLLFAGTVYLRFQYSDMYGKTNSSVQLENTVDSNNASQNTDEVDEGKSTATVILLSISPLITSLVNFFLAFLNDDPVRKKLNGKRLRKLELEEAIGDLEAAVATLDNDVKRELEVDEQAMLAAKAEIDARCDILRALARNLLAEHIKTASGISKISGEKIFNESEHAGNVTVDAGTTSENNIINIMSNEIA